MIGWQSEAGRRAWPPKVLPSPLPVLETSPYLSWWVSAKKERSLLFCLASIVRMASTSLHPLSNAIKWCPPTHTHTHPKHSPPPSLCYEMSELLSGISGELREKTRLQGRTDSPQAVVCGFIFSPSSEASTENTHVADVSHQRPFWYHFPSVKWPQPVCISSLLEGRHKH